jgi:hypothetical protein
MRSTHPAAGLATKGHYFFSGFLIFSLLVFVGLNRPLQGDETPRPVSPEQQSIIVPGERAILFRSEDGTFPSLVVGIGETIVFTRAVEGEPIRNCYGRDLMALNMRTPPEERKPILLARAECIYSLQVAGTNQETLLVQTFDKAGRSFWKAIPNLTGENQNLEDAFPERIGSGWGSEARAKGFMGLQSQQRPFDGFRVEFAASPSQQIVLSMLPALGFLAPLFVVERFKPDGTRFSRQPAVVTPVERLDLSNSLLLSDGRFLVAFQQWKTRPGKIVEYMSAPAPDLLKAKEVVAGTNHPMDPDWAEATSEQIRVRLPRLLGAGPEGYFGADQTTLSWDQSNTEGREKSFAFFYSDLDKKFHRLTYLTSQAPYLSNVFYYKQGVLYVEQNQIRWAGVNCPFSSLRD